MAKDYRLNDHGVDVRLVVSGVWVRVRWNDRPDDMFCYVLHVDKYRKSFTRVRDLVLLEWDKKSATWQVWPQAQSTQIVSVSAVPTKMQRGKRGAKLDQAIATVTHLLDL